MRGFCVMERRVILCFRVTEMSAKSDVQIYDKKPILCTALTKFFGSRHVCPNHEICSLKSCSLEIGKTMAPQPANNRVQTGETLSIRSHLKTAALQAAYQAF
jgi:hypothetical protein